jgi:hypothetical protein
MVPFTPTICLPYRSSIETEDKTFRFDGFRLIVWFKDRRFTEDTANLTIELREKL